MVKRLPKVIFAVQINLAGLSRKVFKLKLKRFGCDGEEYSWWDSSGNIDSNGKNDRSEGYHQLIFKSEKEAYIALRGATMVADFLIERLK